MVFSRCTRTAKNISFSAGKSSAEVNESLFLMKIAITAFLTTKKLRCQFVHYVNIPMQKHPLYHNSFKKSRECRTIQYFSFMYFENEDCEHTLEASH